MLVRVRVLPGWPLTVYRQPQNNEVFTLEPREIDESQVEDTTRRQPFIEIIESDAGRVASDESGSRHPTRDTQRSK